MSRLLVRTFSISLDGYAAVAIRISTIHSVCGGLQLHEWLFATAASLRRSAEKAGVKGSTTISFERVSGVGRTIMGRTCSARYVDRGATVSGPVGGGRSPPFVTRSSCSLTTARSYRMQGEQPSFPLTADEQPSTQHPKLPVIRRSCRRRGWHHQAVCVLVNR